MTTGAVVAGLLSASHKSSPCGFLKARHVDEEDQATRAIENSIRAKELFLQYDTDRSKFLDRDQIVSMLTDLDWSTPPGTLPNQEEIDFVFKVADLDRKQRIDRSEVVYAVMAWDLYLKGKTWRKQASNVISDFQCYDRQGNGKLDKEELRQYLRKLNRYEPVSLDDAEWVLEVADRLGDNAISNHNELLMATAAWQVHKERESARKSKSCSVM